MFGHRCYDVISTIQNAQDGGAQSIRAGIGKRDILAKGCVDELRQFLARLLDHLVDLGSFAIASTARWRTDLALDIFDGCVDRFWLRPTGRGVIQINSFQQIAFHGRTPGNQTGSRLGNENTTTRKCQEATS